MFRRILSFDEPYLQSSSSDNIAFLESLLNDLTISGVQGEAYTEALELAGLVPSPLEQFAILPLIPMNIGNLYFSFTNPSLFMLLTLSLVLLLVHFVTKNGGGNSVPNAWQSSVELIYDFVLNLVNEQMGGLSGNVKQKFFPRISVTFTFLLFRNPQGMIPYSFTVTSHFLITLGLSFSIFIGITIVGFQRNGLHFLSISLPAGVPLPLAPFLVLLELIPHCFRALFFSSPPSPTGPLDLDLEVEQEENRISTEAQRASEANPEDVPEPEQGNAPGSSGKEEEGESSVGLLEWGGHNLFDE